MNPNQTIFLAHDRVADLRHDVDLRAPGLRPAAARRPAIRRAVGPLSRFATAAAALGRRSRRAIEAVSR